MEQEKGRELGGYVFQGFMTIWSFSFTGLFVKSKDIALYAII